METTFGTRNRTNMISLNTFPTSPSRQMLSNQTAATSSSSAAVAYGNSSNGPFAMSMGLMNGSGLMKSKQFGSGGGGSSGSGSSTSPTSPDFNRNHHSQQFPRRFYNTTVGSGATNSHLHHHQQNSHINHIHYQPPAPPLPHHHPPPRHHPVPSSSSTSLHFHKQHFGSSSNGPSHLLTSSNTMNTASPFNGCASGCLSSSSPPPPPPPPGKHPQQQSCSSSTSSSATTTASSSSCSYYDPQLQQQHHHHHHHNHNHHQNHMSKPRHTFVTNYGTEENLYEEIPPDRYFNTLTATAVSNTTAGMAAGNSVTGSRSGSGGGGGSGRCTGGCTSSESSADLNILEAEWKRVQTRHRQVLGQLNLEVETMLMPDESAYQAEPMSLSATPTALANDNTTTKSLSNNSSPRNLANPGAIVAVEDEDDDILDDSIVSIGVGNPIMTVLSAADSETTTKKPHPTLRHHDNIDSGFSGSSSSASYNGSFKRVGFTSAAAAAAAAANQLPCYLIETVSGANNSNRPNHKPSISNSLQLLPSTSSLKQFFAKKSWRKLPGFSVLAAAPIASQSSSSSSTSSGCSLKNSSNSSMVTKNGDNKCKGTDEDTDGNDSDLKSGGGGCGSGGGGKRLVTSCSCATSAIPATTTVRFLPFSTPLSLATSPPHNFSLNQSIIDKQQLNRRQRINIGERQQQQQRLEVPKQLIVAGLEEDCSQQPEDKQLELQTFNCRRRRQQQQQQPLPQPLQQHSHNRRFSQVLCQQLVDQPLLATTTSLSRSITTTAAVNNSITTTANGLYPLNYNSISSSSSSNNNKNNNRLSHLIEPNQKLDRPLNSPIEQNLQKKQQKQQQSSKHDVVVENGDCCDEMHNLSVDTKTSISPFRNGSQFRSTLNKAKNLCDKWRVSTGTSNELPVPSDKSQATGLASHGRISRWFSIRRSSIHQYDIETIENAQFAALPEATATATTTVCSATNPMPLVVENCNDDDEDSVDVVDDEQQVLELAPLVPEIENRLSRSQLKRRMIVADIVHSENSYVATLQRLVYDYKKALEESRPAILSRAKVETLFHCLPEILQCHSSFRALLARSVRNWDRDECIADAFFAAFSKRQVLDVYSEFINNFTTAMQLAKAESKRKSALADFFQVKQISSHDRLSFFGLMVKPVQRFPQFILLLQDLLKHTPHNHHDRISLQLALTQLESMAELLNERKRESEQFQAFKEMLKQIGSGSAGVGKFGLKSSASVSGAALLLANNDRYLLKENDMILLETNPNGVETKTKKRRLLLLNDLVVCLSVSAGSSSQAKRQSMFHHNQKNERLTLKWTHPVADLELVDAVHSPTVTRMLQQRSASSRQTTATSDRQLGEELAVLMHDYKVVSRTIDLMGSLKQNYTDENDGESGGGGESEDTALNVAACRRLLDTIRARMREKDEQIAQLDSCCLQIARKSAEGSEVLMFRTESAATKHEWITEIRLAQLALHANNSPAWLSDKQRPSTKMPLFVHELPVGRKLPDSHQNVQVCCGTFYSRRTAINRRKSKPKTTQTNHLWMGTTDGSGSSQLIVMQQSESGNEAFRVERTVDLPNMRVTALEFVSGCEEALGADTIWCGTVDGKLLVYAAAAASSSSDNDLTLVGTSTVNGSVRAICYLCDSVFVALSTGSIVVYRRDFYERDGAWTLEQHQSIELSEDEGNDDDQKEPSPVSCLLSIANCLYAACGRYVTVLGAETAEIIKRFKIQHANFGRIGQMASSGVSLWLAMEQSPIICLYHTETFRHLQDLNIASTVARISTSFQPQTVAVTKLIASKGLLWVGTNVGVVLTVPLPRLEGVPIIGGQFAVSYHGHFGAIQFLLPLVAVVENGGGGGGSRSRRRDRNRNRPKLQSVSASNTMSSTTTATSCSSGSSNGDEKKVLKEMNFGNVRRTKTMSGLIDTTFENPRLSKTLPRRKPAAGRRPDISDDVYGLYGDLMYVKEYEDTAGDGNSKGRGCGSALFNSPMYETLQRSDPQLCDIPAKVRTIDRRMKLKLTRPRSLDMSDWSVTSKTSSLYTTSSGSDDNLRAFHQFMQNSSSSSSSSPNNVSRNNSNVSANSNSNNNGAISASKQRPQSNQTVSNNDDDDNDNDNDRRQEQHEVAVRPTILIAMGGCGYRNFKQTPAPVTGAVGCAPKKQRDLNQAHVIFWELRL